MKNWPAVLAAVLAIVCSGRDCPAADFNGDGTGDIAVFRASVGLWLARGVTRAYFGSGGDAPVPGDYDGSGTAQPAIFRSAKGLWLARGVTRAYFGGSSDVAMPGDYDGDGTFEPAIFRASSGLWAARGITRIYFGNSADTAISPGNFMAFGAGGRGLLQTGQTSSYRPGDDGAYRKGAAFSYQTSDPAGNGETVASDIVSGLMWASNGSGAGCRSGMPISWALAVDWAEGLTFAGYSDWRLPNRRELESLVDSGKYDPAINTAYFPNTRAGYYWSGSTYAGDEALAWLVNFYYGYVFGGPKTDACFVRAVRGGG